MTGHLTQWNWSRPTKPGCQGTGVVMQAEQCWGDPTPHPGSTCLLPTPFQAKLSVNFQNRLFT